MKRYLAVFTGTTAAMARWESLPLAEQQQRQAAGVAAWKQWVVQHADAIVEMGGPLGRTKRITGEGISDVRNDLTGFTIVQAESQEAAAQMFLNHPHFAIFPGEAVEVMQVMPIPGA